MINSEIKFYTMLEFESMLHLILFSNESIKQFMDSIIKKIAPTVNIYWLREGDTQYRENVTVRAGFVVNILLI